MSRRTPGRPIVIVGDAGLGKTTLLLSFVDHVLTSRNRTPLLVQMALGRPGEALGATIRRQAEIDVDGVIRAGRVPIVAVDAVDEARDEDMDDVFERVLDADETSRAILLLTCRSAHLPPWVRTRADVFELLPLPVDAVTERLRAAVPQAHVGDVDRHLADLCRNPLLLGMTLALLGSDHPDVIEAIGSRAQLYERFFEWLSARDLEKRAERGLERDVPFSAALALLGEVAMSLHHSGQTYAAQTEVERWIIAWVERPGEPFVSAFSGATIREVFDFLRSRPHVRTAPDPVTGQPLYGFLHPSFGDVLAAMAIERSASSPSDVLAARDRRDWPVLVHAVGISDIPGAWIEAMIDLSRDGRQELLGLAAAAVDERWNIDPREIDEILLNILDAFKYGDVAFDYDLMRSAAQISSRRSSFFPSRMIEDLQWFERKYAEVIPKELERSKADELVDLLDASDETLTFDALYTIHLRYGGRHPDRPEMEACILSRLPNFAGRRLEQAVAALKDIGGPASIDALVEVLADPSATARCRAYALNSLANIGDSRHLDLLASDLVDHRNPYRDSASWSLQVLARRLIDAGVNGVAAEIGPVYLEALGSEVDDQEGRYARGNIVYSLGMLGFDQAVDPIARVIEATSDAYVIEDGVNALRLLGATARSSMIEALAHHEDPGIRMKAIEAVATLAPERAERLVSRLESDHFRIVQSYALRVRSVVRQPDRRSAARVHRSLTSPVRQRGNEVVVSVAAEDVPAVEALLESLRDGGQRPVEPRRVSAGARVELTMNPATHTSLCAASADQDG